MDESVEVGVGRILAKWISWLGIAVVILCVFVAVFAGPTGTSIDLFGGFVLVGLPAIPLGLTANGRPRRPVLAVISSLSIVALEVSVVLAFRRDAHSTAVLGFFESMFGAWLIWGMALTIDGIGGSRSRALPPRPDVPD